MKSTCMEQLLALIDMKNFVSLCYPSLTVQLVKISREHEMGRNCGLLLGPQSLKGVALVWLSQRAWYLVTTRVFLLVSVETWRDQMCYLQYMRKILLSPRVEYEVACSFSSATMTMMSLCALEVSYACNGSMSAYIMITTFQQFPEHSDKQFRECCDNIPQKRFQNVPRNDLQNVHIIAYSRSKNHKHVRRIAEPRSKIRKLPAFWESATFVTLGVPYCQAFHHLATL